MLIKSYWHENSYYSNHVTANRDILHIIGKTVLKFRNCPTSMKITLFMYNQQLSLKNFKISFKQRIPEANHSLDN